ncbi:MAG: EcsC family protein [Fibromonadales bacterium]|nr:EcsC family protein [Fibromonadales bacterium]
MSKITDPAIQQAIECAYEKAFEGFSGMDSAFELAQFYKEKYPSDKLEQANALINRQIAAGATSGFITKIGGLTVFPVDIPVNLVSLLFIQTRLIMAIAVIGGHDPKDVRVKALALSCLAGNTAIEQVSQVALTKVKFLDGLIGGTKDAVLVASTGKIAKSIFIE